MEQTSILEEQEKQRAGNSKLELLKQKALAACPKSKIIGNYIIGKTIGEGTFGKVKKGQHILTGEPVAIKILEKARIVDVTDVERVSREIHILKLIRHPHVIQLYEIIETPKHIFLVMEYCSGGEVFDYIVVNTKLQEEEASKFFQELLVGIEYLHKLQIVHRDLKPENLLLDHMKSIKIVDFGLSNTYKKNELLKTACGSPCYAAPEMIAGKKYESTLVDIWSCGVILFALLCGYLPFEDQNTSCLYRKILSGDYQLPDFLSDDAKDLIKHILNTDPTQRYNFEQIKKHPWYNIYQRTHQIPPGIIIGYNKIPIDELILEQVVDQYGYNRDYVRRCIDANKHNEVTTAYNLLLRKYVQSGGTSAADLNSNQFDAQPIQQQKSKPFRQRNLQSIMDNNMSLLNSADKNNCSVSLVDQTMQATKINEYIKSREKPANDELNVSMSYAVANTSGKRVSLAGKKKINDVSILKELNDSVDNNLLNQTQSPLKKEDLNDSIDNCKGYSSINNSNNLTNEMVVIPLGHTAQPYNNYCSVNENHQREGSRYNQRFQKQSNYKPLTHQIQKKNRDSSKLKPQREKSISHSNNTNNNYNSCNNTSSNINTNNNNTRAVLNQQQQPQIIQHQNSSKPCKPKHGYSYSIDYKTSNARVPQVKSREHVEKQSKKLIDHKRNTSLIVDLNEIKVKPNLNQTTVYSNRNNQTMNKENNFSFDLEQPVPRPNTKSSHSNNNTGYYGAGSKGNKRVLLENLLKTDYNKKSSKKTSIQEKQQMNYSKNYGIGQGQIERRKQFAL